MRLEPAIVSGLEERLEAHAGLHPPKWLVEARALARMEMLGLDAAGYLALLRSKRGASELGALVEAVRVGETRFFRHRAQIDALLEVVVPAWSARGETSPRIWSAGCASGEEAYTLAAVLAHAFPRGSPTILATDVSAEALAIARRGVYPSGALEHVPDPWRKCFVVAGAHVRVKDDVASLVRFERSNLADRGQPRGFDLVWCRNVLIYFDARARKRVVDELVAALLPGGFLFVGYSESLREVSGLTPTAWRDQVLYVKAPPTPAIRETPPSAPARSSPKLPRGGGPPSGRERSAAAKAPRSTRRTTRLVRVTRDAGRDLSADIGAALGSPGIATLTVDLDGADYLDDGIAPILRRARAAARASGIEMVLVATRPGAKRWLRRNRLGGGDA